MSTIDRVTMSIKGRNLTNSIQAATAKSLMLQNQMSTGHRIINPSDDPVGSSIVSALQDQLSAKTQYLQNISTVSGRLDVIDSTLNEATTIATDAKSVALEQVNASSSAESRSVSASQISESLNSLVSLANAKFGNRYLFSGTQVGTAPFELTQDGVVYNGDITAMQSNIAEGARSEIEVNGADAFGALTSEVTGRVNLNPRVNLGSSDNTTLNADGTLKLDVPTYATRLSDLNGGSGVSKGKIAVSIDSGSPKSFYTVDLSTADSLEDVATEIQKAIPGAAIKVFPNANGTGIKLVSAGNTITVKEVGENTTGRDLGLIPSGSLENSATDTLVGDDINPALTAQTRISDLMPTTMISTVGSSTATTITDANLRGSSLVAVGQVVKLTSGDDMGREATITAFDAATGTITFNYNPALSAAPEAGTQYNIFDPSAAALGNVHVENGSKSIDINLSTASTVQDVLKSFNTAGLFLDAQINSDGTGINIVSRLNGAALKIQDSGGDNTASILGVSSFSKDISFDKFQNGTGVNAAPGSTTPVVSDTFGAAMSSVADPYSSVATDTITTLTPATAANLATIEPGMTVVLKDTLGNTVSEGTVVRKTGTTFDFIPGSSVSTAVSYTVEDRRDFKMTVGGDTIGVDLSAIPNSENTTRGLFNYMNRLSQYQTSFETLGITLDIQDSGIQIDPNGNAMTLTAVNNSETLTDLGLTERTVASADVVQGTDPYGIKTDSIFTGMQDLKNALLKNDTAAISEAGIVLDRGFELLVTSRAKVGTRGQRIESTEARLQSEIDTTKAAISSQLDVDYVSAASEYQLQQTALSAALQTSGEILQVSLLDYL